jgi:hypothetical protein
MLNSIINQVNDKFKGLGSHLRFLGKSFFTLSKRLGGGEAGRLGSWEARKRKSWEVGRRGSGEAEGLRF